MTPLFQYTHTMEQFLYTTKMFANFRRINKTKYYQIKLIIASIRGESFSVNDTYYLDNDLHVSQGACLETKVMPSG